MKDTINYIERNRGKQPKLQFCRELQPVATNVFNERHTQMTPDNFITRIIYW
jgi:hypothetical protein